MGMGRRRKKSFALRPIGSSSTAVQLRSRMAFCAALITFALNAPASPLSEVTTRRRTFCSSRVSSSGCFSSSTRVATDDKTCRSAAEYGRAANIRSCARRSLAAETIFMALVICCVFFTLRIRRRMSIVLAIRLRGFPARPLLLLECVDGGAQLAGQRVVELRGLLDPIEQIGVVVEDRLVQGGLERPHIVDCQVVEEAVGTGEDRDDLQTDAHRLI